MRRRETIAIACERGRDAANTAILIERHPDYPISIRIAYEGGIRNPYPWWRPWMRRAWQIAFTGYRFEHDRKKWMPIENDSSSEGDPVEGGSERT